MSRTTPRIALLVDQPQRDLGGLVLVADALARAGAVPYLVPANLRHRELFALAPDFVLFYNLRRGYETLVAQLIDASIGFGLSDAEGGVWQDLDAYTELLIEDRSLLHAAACVCMWGPRMTEHVVREGYFTQEQITVTGCPRFDFYHESWRSVVSAAAGRRDRILVNTNFADANPRFTTLDGIRALYVEKFSWRSERIEAWLELQARGIEGMIGLTRQIALDHPDHTVVVRPHPFEGADWYRRELEQLPNVTFSTSGPVQPEINAAAAVLQRSCTTAIEAVLAGVPTFSPQWVDTPAVMPMSEVVSVPCASLDDMRRDVGAVLTGTFRTPDTTRTAIDDVIHDWFLSGDGQAHQRVADVVMRCARRAAGADRRKTRRHLHGVDARFPSGGGSLGRRARYWLGMSPEWSFGHRRAVPTTGFLNTDQYFGADQVQGVVAQIERRANGRTHAAAPRATLARERGHYVHRYGGQAVVLEFDNGRSTAAPADANDRT